MSCIASQAFMDSVLGVVRFLQAGIQTNWFGLACPHHCGPSSFSTVLAAFLAGVLCSLLCGLCLSLWIFGFNLPCATSQQSGVDSPAAVRLARYLSPAVDASARPRHRRAWTGISGAEHFCEGSRWVCCLFCSWTWIKQCFCQLLWISAVSCFRSSSRLRCRQLQWTFPCCFSSFCCRFNLFWVACCCA